METRVGKRKKQRWSRSQKKKTVEDGKGEKGEATLEGNNMLEIEKKRSAEPGRSSGGASLNLEALENLVRVTGMRNQGGTESLIMDDP